MRYGFFVAGVLAAGLSFVTTAQAADVPRIGVVNIQQVIAKSHRGQDASAKLSALSKKVNGDVRDQYNKVMVVKQQFEKADSKSADYAKLQKNFQDSAAEFQQYRDAQQQNLEERRQELLKPIEEELQQVLVTFAKDHHYDILMNQGGGAIYSSDKYDVTTQVTEAMDKDWAEQQASDAKPNAKSKDSKGGGK
ncbi:MAG TPA: OmpH family outer membrane protein [Gammaproteobacteria bacterium]|jgi:Skp family chaperone for outer membrane proteins|nr:OmpH family outer membrane protein [Gammaproteobacteria bacterium]